jgi:hypothetical protein
MPYTLPLLAVADGVYALFQDQALQALLPGGVQTDVPANNLYPFLWFEVLHQQNYGGLGTKPGRGSMPGCTVRLHVFQSEGGTVRDSQIAMAKAIELLFSGALTVDGYTVAGGEPLPEIDGVPLSDEELNGVKVHELVYNVDLIIEEL